MFSDVEAYDRLMGRQSRILAPLFVEFLGGIHNGDCVLDVGCGTGSLTFTIANTAQPSKIVGIDPSVPFIEYARSTNADPRVTFDVGDAQQLPYPDASFDKSLSFSQTSGGILACCAVPMPVQPIDTSAERNRAALFFIAAFSLLDSQFSN